MDAYILSIGSELTTGQTVDTNGAWLSAELTRRGVRVVGHATVDDDLARIVQAMRRAMEGADLVVATGGLGPTPDDLTRQALADAIGEPLREDAAALAQLQAMFDRWQRTMSDSNRIQALIPRGCRAIRNSWGTAPGIAYEGGRSRFFAIPGVPGEMRAMFEAEIAPIVEAQVGAMLTHISRLRCFGISEAKVGELLADLMRRDRNPQVGTAAAHAVITVRVVGTGTDEDDARRLVEADLAEIRARLGAGVFGREDERLEEVVGRLLAERGLTVSTAESCTGGLLAKRLTDIPGSSTYFLRGYVTYANAAKSDLLGVEPEIIATHGAVSEPVAAAMALGCRTASKSDYALAMTGIAGPGGGESPDRPVGLVYLGLADATGTAVKRLLVGEHLNREEIRDRAAGAALNWLRLRLIGAESQNT